MLDIKTIRQYPESLDTALSRRGKEPMAATILALDTEHRTIQAEVQALQTTRNAIAKQFGDAKRQGLDTAQLAQQADDVKQQLTSCESQAQALQEKLTFELSSLPNIPAIDVPEGHDETQNVEIRRHGQPPQFNFTPQAHFDLGEKLGMMDFERAAKISGARFVVLKHDLARLERALGTFMLDIHTREFGYTEIYPPVLVNDAALYGTGQLPKFRDDQFQTTSGHWLIPTAEVVLTNLVAGDILPVTDLPLRYTAYTPCFRLEAGSAGRDTRGMIRQHQFGKVELVSIVDSDSSEKEHERMTQVAETILQRLGLSYRVLALCAGDMGFSAQKTYDLEVWLPSQNTYREISSCSNCGDFQARRMNTRFRPTPTADQQKPATAFVHTLNGSGLAVGRTLVAILENYQREDGSIQVPEILVPYMGGIEIISKKE